MPHELIDMITQNHHTTLGVERIIMTDEKSLQQGYDDFLDGNIFPPENCTEREKFFWSQGYNRAKLDCLKGSIGTLLIFGGLIFIILAFCYYVSQR